MKKYRITFKPTITLAKELKNPYEPYDVDNLGNDTPLIYVYSNRESESITVKAPNKEIAKALFAVEIYKKYIGAWIKDGGYPLIIDALRNIESIEEVSSDE
jgi:hypothetical protein